MNIATDSIDAPAGPVEAGSVYGSSADWFPIQAQGSCFQLRNRWQAKKDIFIDYYARQLVASILGQSELFVPAPTEWYLVSSAAPPPPTGLSVVASNGVAIVSWGPVAGATSYNIYVATSSGGEVYGTPAYNDSSSQSNSIVTGLTDGVTYYIEVTAVNSNGESALSSEVNATQLEVPTGLTATAGNGQVTLSWQPVVGATSYKVYWATSQWG